MRVSLFPYMLRRSGEGSHITLEGISDKRILCHLMSLGSEVYICNGIESYNERNENAYKIWYENFS
jgi:hypothetical protein